MIKVVFFDLGETLLHGDEPFPHAVAALEEISGFQTEEGSPLFLAIISDFDVPGDPHTEAQVQVREHELAAVIQGAGLESFFSPFATRVTISARAGVRKPDHRIFELAAQRSGTGAALAECLFITETQSHLLAAQNLGLAVLGFGAHLGDLPSFTDWRDAPALIAGFVNPATPLNRRATATRARAGGSPPQRPMPG